MSILLRDVDEAGAADGGVVGSDLLSGGGVAGREVHHTGSFVCAGSDYFGAILSFVSEIEGVNEKRKTDL